jgi:hypothetical protein
VANLQADKKFTFAMRGIDEANNPAPLPGPPATFAVDRPDILTLTDNGDGTGEVAATGVLGTAVLTADGATDTGLSYHGVIAIEVVPGDAAAVEIVLGEPTEVTPD